jgi:hypothetical protein
MDPAENGVSFISNENIDLVKQCEQKLAGASDLSLHIVSSMFYISKNDCKPIKSEEKFYIFSRQLSKEEERKK